MSEDRFGIVGKVVARTYRVESFVAEGGFGVVYRAHHKGFRAPVALKCLKIPEALGAEQRTTFLGQFRAEAELLFKLSARIPAIVRPLHIDVFQLETRTVPFIALEWLEGRTLDAIIARRKETGRGGLDLVKLVELFTPVAAGLEQAHHFPSPTGPMTVIHRDLKPENLFVARVGAEDIGKILDFGISKVKSAAGQLAGRLSQTGEALSAFSPGYAAPEQWAPRSLGQTGKWTDVWGLALCLVEAMKGEEIIQGELAEMMGVALDPARRPTPRTLGVTVSDQVEEAFARALAVDPRERTQTVGEFWDGLTAALGIRARVGSISQKETQAGGRRLVTVGFESVAPRAPEVPLAVPRSPEIRVAGSRGADLRDANSRSADSRGGEPRPPLSSGVLSQPRSAAAVRPSAWKQLSPALALGALSLALTGLDRAYIAVHGTALSLGPIRTSWVAAGVMLLALVSAAQVLLKMNASPE